MTPAEAIATSVPAPIAMPTSAWASAGASLTPSPTIATVRPSACSCCDLGGLVLRADAGEVPVDAELGGDGARRPASASPVIITTSMPRRVQRVDGLPGLGADLVGQRSAPAT